MFSSSPPLPASPRRTASAPSPLRADRLSPGRRLAARIEDGIRSGTLAPGAELALPEIARRHQLRTPALTLALHALVRDGLLTVRGDLATVSALSAQELDRVRQLRRPLLDYLFDRAHRHSPKTQLPECGRLIDTIDPDTAGLVSPSAWVGGMRQFVLGLVGPTASAAERLTVWDLFDASFRYQALGWRRIAANGADVLALRREHLASCRDLLDGMRSPRPRPVLQLAGRRDEQVHRIAESSLGSSRGLAEPRTLAPAPRRDPSGWM
jgi:DNA-binding GntR family transcriptional regulator